jgi:hypothetical protein
MVVNSFRSCRSRRFRVGRFQVRRDRFETVKDKARF